MQVNLFPKLQQRMLEGNIDVDAVWLMLRMLWRMTRLRGWCPRLRRICLCQSSSGTECSCSRCTWSGLSILISSARQSLWLVLSDVSATMHYVLYVCVCCLHIIILSKGLSVNHVFLPTTYFHFPNYLLQSLHWSPSAHWPYCESLLPPEPPQMSPAKYNADYQGYFSFNSTDLVPFCTAPRRVWRCDRGHRCPPDSGESSGLGGRSTRGPGVREIECAARIMRSGQI